MSIATYTLALQGAFNLIRGAYEASESINASLPNLLELLLALAVEYFQIGILRLVLAFSSYEYLDVVLILMSLGTLGVDWYIRLSTGDLPKPDSFFDEVAVFYVFQAVGLVGGLASLIVRLREVYSRRRILVLLDTDTQQELVTSIPSKGYDNNVCFYAKEIGSMKERKVQIQGKSYSDASTKTRFRLLAGDQSRPNVMSRKKIVQLFTFLLKQFKESSAVNKVASTIKNAEQFTEEDPLLKF